MINIIVAVDKNNGIGKDNKLPWILPEDLKYFKKKTLYKPIILGRKTMQSLPGMLPGRKHIMLSRTQYPNTNPEFINFQNVEDVLNHIKYMHKGQDVFVIGGAEIYKQFINYADKIYMTYIDKAFDCDTFFEWNKNDWELISEEKGIKDEKNNYDYFFRIFEKKK